MRKILFNLTVFIFVSVNFSNAQTRVPNDGVSPIYYKNGNVGIGVEDPNSALEVYGAIHSRVVDGENCILVTNENPIVDKVSELNAYRMWARGENTLWKMQAGLTSSTTWTGDGTTKTWLGLGTKNKYGIALVSGHKNNTMSQINSRLMIGYDSWSPDFTKADVLSVNGNTLIEGRLKATSNYLINRGFFIGSTEQSAEIYKIGFKKAGLQSLSGGGSLPWDEGLTIESDQLITFHETDGNVVRGWMDVNNSKFIWNGSVGIGETSPEAKLHVAGDILADEIRVEDIAAANVTLNGTLAANNITYTANGQTADYVFEEDYNLRSLEEIESFILENKHLPDVPSAAAMEEEGVNLAEMNKLLLQKVEELTLYAIEQESRLMMKDEEMKEMRSEMECRLAKMEVLLEQLLNR